MSRRSSSSTPQARRSSGKSRLRERRQVLDQRLHRRIEPVALAQLQRQAFGEDCGRIRRSARGPASGRARLRRAGRGVAEPFGDLVERADKISGLVSAVDQRGADHPVGRIGEKDRGLALEMVAQRHGFGDISLELRARRLAFEPPPTPVQASRDKPSGGWAAGTAARSGPRSKAFSTSVPRLAARPAASVSSASAAQSPGSAGASAKPPRSALGRLGARFLALLRPLEQRVAGQFILDELRSARGSASATA